MGLEISSGRGMIREGNILNRPISSSTELFYYSMVVEVLSLTGKTKGQEGCSVDNREDDRQSLTDEEQLTPHIQ